MIEQLRALLEEMQGCFHAASAEGLEEKMRDYGCEIGGIADIVQRRLLWVPPLVEQAFALLAQPSAGDAGGVVDFLLRQLVQVKGPANTVMWESPDGQGGQFADKGVALLCWLNRTALPALPQQWLPIESVPRNKPVDTYGEFKNKRTGKSVRIRHADDFISATSPDPFRRTYHEYEGAVGTYTRSHWMALPIAPKQEG